MDPNATLAEIRALLERMNEGLYVPAMIATAGELAERVEALDTWLAKGGFLPDDWAKQKAFQGWAALPDIDPNGEEV